jgi:hypothetical protein
MTVQGTIPPPPPGPGVQPPFVAPPTDGIRQRRWLAIGLAAGVVVVLCAGAVVGIGALGIFGQQMVAERSQAAVSDYLTQLQKRDFDHAWSLLCPAEQRRVNTTSFERLWQARPRISTFTVGKAAVGNTVVVPARVDNTDGTSDALRFPMEQDPSSGDFQVCAAEG